MEKSYFQKPSILKAFLISIIFGGTLETLQSLIPDRHFDFSDMLANLGGALIGIGILKIFSKIQPDI